MSSYPLRAMQHEDWDEVAALIFHSTNAWYTANGKPAIFQGETSAARLFCEVYEALDPGCCVVARLYPWNFVAFLRASFFARHSC